MSEFMCERCGREAKYLLPGYRLQEWEWEEQEELRWYCSLCTVQVIKIVTNSNTIDKLTWLYSLLEPADLPW